MTVPKLGESVSLCVCPSLNWMPLLTYGSGLASGYGGLTYDGCYGYWSPKGYG